MRRALIALMAAACIVPAAAHAQQTGSEQERRAREQARRDSLETEIVHRFVRRLSRDLELSDQQRSQIEDVLRESGRNRRELSRASGALRGQIYRATRNSSTPDADFTRLLSEYETLRGREHDLWRREQQQLSAVLSPRQRAQFFMAWARFQDEMREIIARRMRDQDGSRDRRQRRDSTERPTGTPPPA
ncbi:MAG TPA: Spy/CpxP family protein refolding chaperone [Longimicrobiales bacterium]